MSSSSDDNEPVICWGKRTAFCKSMQGSFRGLSVGDLLVPLLKELQQENPKLPISRVGDVVIGIGLAMGSFGTTEVRMATHLADIPLCVPSHTLNRHCGSGLQAVIDVSANIRAGNYEIGVAGGAESMSTNWKAANEQVVAHKEADVKTRSKDELQLINDYYLSMGETSEELAARFHVSREQQDSLAVASHRRAFAATQSGRLAEEIVPIAGKTAAGESVLVSADEGIRGDTSLERLATLRTPFREGGSTTAGNASQVSDGAALLLVASRRSCREMGLPELGRLVASATVGVDPAIMGAGPSVAIPAVLAKAGLTLAEIDLFEINEAFASQCFYCVQTLGIDSTKVNVNGGAIALGHPLGATGARLIITLLLELRRRSLRYGIVSLCIGSGMGIAAVFENLALAS